MPHSSPRHCPGATEEVLPPEPPELPFEESQTNHPALMRPGESGGDMHSHFGDCGDPKGGVTLAVTDSFSKEQCNCAVHVAQAPPLLVLETVDVVPAEEVFVPGQQQIVGSSEVCALLMEGAEAEETEGS